jgi:hypothetical protein
VHPKLKDPWIHMDPRLGDPTEEEEGCQQREAMPMPGGWEKPYIFSWVKLDSEKDKGQVGCL